MNYEQKISKAKAKLLVDKPFLGTLASRLKLMKNDDIQAFTSDGIQFEYNDDFIHESSLEELEFTFANGAMHASMAYDNRQGNRSNWLWQLSCDYAINDMLVQSGMQRPYQAHYSERFTNMYVEEIYAELKADIIRDENEMPKNQDDDTQTHSNTHEQIQEQTLDEQLFKEFAASVLDTYEKKGELPESIERFFKIEPFSKLDWREQLRDALNKFAKDDYTQMPPNKKFLSQGIYLPSSTSETFELVIAVDSSGSVDAKLLEAFLSEINSLMLSIPKYKIDLLICDDKIRVYKEFFSGEFLDIDLVGGGATDFRPVFEFIDKELHNTKMLLYFTDLEGIFPKEHPCYEVKWISPKMQEVSFGEIIQI